MSRIMRKTKIICTMGPATRDMDTIIGLIQAGMNIARFNFSHGTHAFHQEMIERVKDARQKCGIPVALLLDTKGPEIRTGLNKDNQPIVLRNGARLLLVTEEVLCTETCICISYQALPQEVKCGTQIFIADGRVNLEVIRVVDRMTIECLVKSGAEIGSQKNVNVVGVRTSLPAVTPRDLDDIMFGVAHGIDFIAASFIRKPADIKEIRGAIDICDVDIDIIAKVEDQEGLENISDIIRVSNGVMVARGDLGVQLRAEEVPLAQKRIIEKCNESNKPVITATQMLESMVSNPTPTRAEITDVANAIFDGTDALMLSGETANGAYPVQSVQMMHKIALEIENSPEYQKERRFSAQSQKANIADTIARAAYFTARDIGVDAILTPTLHGNTPKLISKYRPSQHILAVTPYEEVRRKLLLYWGVYPVLSPVASDSDAMLESAIRAGTADGVIHPFDKLIILAGIPLDSPIMLNTIRFHMVAQVLGKSMRGYGSSFSGRIVKVATCEEAAQRLQGDGTEILLTRYIDESFLPLLKKVGGYILEEFSSMSWNDICVINPSLVALAGAYKVLNCLEDGQIVTIDGNEKLIYEGRIPQRSGPQ
jgi:pyruvate kinase